MLGERFTQWRLGNRQFARHRRVRRERRLLRQVGDACAASKLALSSVGLHFARKQSEEGGLPRPVDTDEPYTLPLFDDDRQTFEKDSAPERERKIGGAEEGHRCDATRWLGTSVRGYLGRRWVGLW